MLPGTAMAPLLLLLAIAAPPVTAVADLSVRPEPAVAAALRTLPDLAGEPLPAKKTALVVTDAAKLGIVCSISDARCLQKILVLARVDELIAFEVSGKSLSIARITARTATFAKTRKRAGAAASARAAWAALARAAQATTPLPREELPREQPESEDVAREDEEPGEGEERASRPPPRSAATPTAITGGLTPTLLTAGVGAGATVLFGAATLGVSAVVANQIRATERGVPLDASYDAMSATFWILAGLTAASAATGAVAGALHLLDDGAAPEAVSGP